MKWLLGPYILLSLAVLSLMSCTPARKNPFLSLNEVPWVPTSIQKTKAKAVWPNYIKARSDLEKEKEIISQEEQLKEQTSHATTDPSLFTPHF